MPRDAVLAFSDTDVLLTVLLGLGHEGEPFAFGKLPHVHGPV